jgi:hypothetical protein
MPPGEVGACMNPSDSRNRDGKSHSPFRHYLLGSRFTKGIVSSKWIASLVAAAVWPDFRAARKLPAAEGKSSHSSPATMPCFGATILTQCAGEEPTQLCVDKENDDFHVTGDAADFVVVAEQSWHDIMPDRLGGVCSLGGDQGVDPILIEEPLTQERCGDALDRRAISISSGF